MEITSLNQLDFSKRYTYADYLSWKIDIERAELYYGEVMPMTTPWTLHQEIVGALICKIGLFFKKTSIEVFSRIDVALLPKDETDKTKIHTVVQPDLCVIVDKQKLVDEHGCTGSPDLIIEVLPVNKNENRRKEMRDKLELYEAAGVLEYWIVDPVHQVVYQHLLDATGKFTILPYLVDDDVLTSAIFEDLKIDLSEIFPKHLYKKPQKSYSKTSSSFGKFKNR
jgi:Uma2 family endonuclease